MNTATRVQKLRNHSNVQAQTGTDSELEPRAACADGAVR